MNKIALFNELCVTQLQASIDVCNQRGDAYGDTLGEMRPLQLRAVASELGIDIRSDEQAVALAIAGLCDIKYWRNLGGYNEDTITDGINYLSVTPGLIARAKASVQDATFDVVETEDEFEGVPAPGCTADPEEIQPTIVWEKSYSDYIGYVDDVVVYTIKVRSAEEVNLWDSTNHQVYEMTSVEAAVAKAEELEAARV